MQNKELLKLEIGKRVQKIRVEIMHMSKNEFANLIGMKNQYLGTVESGQKGLTVEKVIEICNKTGVSSDFLLRGISNPLQKQAEDMLSKYTNEDIYKAFEIMKDLSLLLK